MKKPVARWPGDFGISGRADRALKREKGKPEGRSVELEGSGFGERKKEGVKARQ